MLEFGLTEEHIAKIDWATDRGANMIAALADCEREDCVAHLLNTVTKSTPTLTYVELRQKATEENLQAQEIFKRFGEAAKIVRSVKKKENLNLDFDLTKLQEKIQAPRPHLSSYGHTPEA